MCEITDHVTRFCGSNAGGITNVWMIATQDIASEGTISGTTHELSALPTLEATKSFFRVEFTEETGIADDMLTGEKDAEFVQLDLKFTVPGLLRANIAQYQKFLGGRFVFVVQYTDGQARQFGSKLNGLSVKPAQKSGQYAGTARRGAEFECKGVAATYAPFLSPADLITFVATLVAA